MSLKDKVESFYSEGAVPPDYHFYWKKDVDEAIEKLKEELKHHIDLYDEEDWLKIVKIIDEEFGK